MIQLAPVFEKGKPIRILCLGAHCDDIEIGCGGFVLQFIEANPSCEVLWIVFSSNEVRRNEAQLSADLFLKNAIKKEIVIKKYRDGFFPSHYEEIKEDFENIKGLFNPDLIFTHYNEDLHQDHRIISQLTWNTFRDHLILEYEIQKYDGDMGRPNIYAPLSLENMQQKLNIILDSFQSQHSRKWFEAETFSSLMRLRGMESNSPSRYAEAYYGRKISI
jgi:LmbE family N-acetylglucosaminyl deacetylase